MATELRALNVAINDAENGERWIWVSNPPPFICDNALILLILQRSLCGLPTILPTYSRVAVPFEAQASPGFCSPLLVRQLRLLRQLDGKV
jgi:hypothetical protein